MESAFICLVVAVAGLLTWGVIFILRAFNKTQDEQAAPIADIKEKYPQQASAAPLPDPITSHILKQNLGGTDSAERFADGYKRVISISLSSSKCAYGT